MFTGLIRGTGTIRATTPQGQGRTLSVDIAALGSEVEVGASICISGVCLTMTSIRDTLASFDVVAETARRSTLGHLPVGAPVNLEPSLRVGDPLDGHMVLGHVDGQGQVQEIQERAEGWLLRFSLPEAIRPLVATKGSIAVDGISLTVVEAGQDWFSVSVIPHTYAVTTLATVRKGDAVNLEADVLARYVARRAEVQASGLSEAFLREHGFA